MQNGPFVTLLYVENIEIELRVEQTFKSTEGQSDRHFYVHRCVIVVLFQFKYIKIP